MIKKPAVAMCIAIVLIVLLGPAVVAATVQPAFVLGPDGFGPVRIGMTPSQLTRALRTGWRYGAPDARSAEEGVRRSDGERGDRGDGARVRGQDRPGRSAHAR